MADYSGNIIGSVQMIVENAISKLQFDQTVMTEIVGIKNLDLGEYKVLYQNNTFSAFAQDITEQYKVGDQVYVKIPYNDYAKKKIIQGKVSNTESLTEFQQNELRNHFQTVGPKWGDTKHYGYNPDQNIYSITSNGEQQSVLIWQHSDNVELVDNLLQQYNDKYHFIKLTGDFLTQFDDIVTSGNYGLKFTFRSKVFAESNAQFNLLTYVFDLAGFNGSYYQFSNYTHQEIICEFQESYLLGLEKIELFMDGIPRAAIGGNTVKVKDVDFQFMANDDLTQAPYYLNILSPNGDKLNDRLSLTAQLISYGSPVQCDYNSYRWYVKDLDAEVTGVDAEGDQWGGNGWRFLTSGEELELVNDTNKMGNPPFYHDNHSLLEYKVVAIADNGTQLESFIKIRGLDYYEAYELEQYNDETGTFLRVTPGEQLLRFKWYITTSDGNRFAADSDSNVLQIDEWLKYSSIFVECEVLNADDVIIRHFEKSIFNMTSADDAEIIYKGNTTFLYNTNGDISYEDYERERTIEPSVLWKEGYGLEAYSYIWRDMNGNDLDELRTYMDNEDTMIATAKQVGNSLVFSIKQKYNVRAKKNDFTLVIRAINGKEYSFTKTVEFTKEGDQDALASTFSAAVRPTATSKKYLDAHHENTMSFSAVVYQDGKGYTPAADETITYTWKASPKLEIIPSNSNNTIQVRMNGIDSVQNQYYVKCNIDITKITKDTQGKSRQIYSYHLYPFCPVDVLWSKSVNTDFDDYKMLNYIQYNAEGVAPSNYDDTITSVEGYDRTFTSSLFYEQDNKLKLNPIYYGSNYQFGGIKYTKDNVIYLHTIITTLDTSNTQSVEGWDGSVLDTGIQDGTSYNNSNINIIGVQAGAGTMTAEGGFRGVVMGRYDNNYGIYGFNGDTNTFSFKEDGTGHIGNKAKGYIDFDGNKATLGGRIGNSADNQYTTTLRLNSDSANATPENVKAIEVLGKKTTDEQGNVSYKHFSVNYDGYMEANSGLIGGWYIDDTKLEGRQGNEVYTRLNKNGVIDTQTIMIIKRGEEDILIGQVGVVEGNDGQPTNNLGLVTGDPNMSIILQSANNIALRPNFKPTNSRKYTLYLDGSDNSADANNENASLVCNIPANNQHGIYARFG